MQAAASAAAEELKQAEERAQQAQQECGELRSRTSAAERARLDATRALEDANSAADGLRRERDRLGKRGREAEERAARDAAEARKEVQCVSAAPYGVRLRDAGASYSRALRAISMQLLNA